MQDGTLDYSAAEFKIPDRLQGQPHVKRTAIIEPGCAQSIIHQSTKQNYSTEHFPPKGKINAGLTRGENVGGMEW